MLYGTGKCEVRIEWSYMLLNAVKLRGNNMSKLASPVVSETRNAVIAKLTEMCKTRAAVNHTYLVKEDGDLTIKLPPQAVEVLSCLFNIGKAMVTDAEIREALKTSTLKTKQDKFMIFRYYRNILVEAGWLSVK